MKAPAFSVVIPCRDDRPYLEALVAALKDLEPPRGGYEVIFVDDRSRDGSGELLEGLTRDDPRFRVLRNPGRAGPDASRNFGLGHARGRFVAFSDSDAVPEPDWLLQAAAGLRRHRSRAIEGRVKPWAEMAAASPTVWVPQNLDGGRYMTANMVYESALVRSLGGFDEGFGLPHFLGDVDLAYRAMDAGVSIPYVPECAVRHHFKELTPSAYLGTQGKLQWVPRIARKHPVRHLELLRSRVQRLRPGDADLLLSGALLLATARRGGWPARGLSLALAAIAVRRVLSHVELGRVPPERRPAWVAALLVAPALRAGYLVKGWVRFRRIVI